MVEFAIEGTACTLAWVRTDCSAAFPIAVGKSGRFREPQPLYEDSGSGD